MTVDADDSQRDVSMMFDKNLFNCFMQGEDMTIFTNQSNSNVELKHGDHKTHTEYKTSINKKRRCPQLKI